MKPKTLQFGCIIEVVVPDRLRVDEVHGVIENVVEHSSARVALEEAFGTWLEDHALNDEERFDSAVQYGLSSFRLFERFRT